ncbi:sugar ABC transporter permease [Chloroflexi bacterium TSY]|nr:sugar ABC transporter permease [Chloroflexi bacterium TSY]
MDGAQSENRLHLHTLGHTPENHPANSSIMAKSGVRPHLSNPWWQLHFGYIQTMTLIGVLLYFGVLVAPLFLSFYYSFTNMNLLKASSDFVGWRNYINLAQDPTFRSALLFTVNISIVVTLGVNLLGLGVAMLLNQRGRFFAFLRTLFFVPQVLSAVIVSFIWGIMLSNRNGILNTILQQIGVLAPDSNIPWLGDPQLAFFSIGLVTIWTMLGFSVVVYLAALQGIPDDLKAAAKVDGANRAQSFRHVTFPLLAPGVTINVVLLLIITLKIYDVIVVMTAGGPGGATESLAFYIVRMAFTANKTGYASALSVVLFILIAVTSATLAGYLRRREIEY